MEKLWQVYPKLEQALFAKYPDISPVILQLLNNRQIKATEYEEFLKPDFSSLPSPSEFKDMTQACQVIINHIKQQHKIVVCGDYDADGVTSSALLSGVLKILKASVEVYIPDRSSEGYGLNQAAIKTFADNEVKLIITVDNGIRNKAEIEFAQSLGLTVIVTDHHVFPEEEKDWPQCLIINPANPKDNYPYKNLAGVGVAFKLASALINNSTLSDSDKEKLIIKQLDLVALGTVADLVPLVGENRVLVKKGLEVLNNGLKFFHKSRLGVKQLIKESGLNISKDLETWNISFQLAPRLNASGRIGRANTAFDLLVAEDRALAKHLSEELDSRNQDRQIITQDIFAEALDNIKEQETDNALVALAQDSYWNEGVLGLVAGKLSDKYYRPSLVITRIEEDGKLSFKGSGRSIAEFNLMTALEDLSQYLDKYGGHPLACGFSIYNENNLNKFITGFKKLADKVLAGQTLSPKLSIDMELPLSQVDRRLLVDLDKLRPYGQNNPRPKFISYAQPIDDIITMGVQKQHIKLRFDNIWALAFGKSEIYKDLQVGDLVDIVYQPEFNYFNGSQSVQLKIIDLKKHEE